MYTDDVIAVAKIAKDQLLDIIPLADIIGIEDVPHREETLEIESAMETAVDFTNAFQIRTKRDGYNAGRSYYFRSDGDLGNLIEGIVAASKAAARKANARTRWENVQDKARSLYNASWFQGVAAFLIIAVRAALSPVSTFRNDAGLLQSGNQ